MTKEQSFWQKKQDFILIVFLLSVGLLAWFLGQRLNKSNSGYIIKSYIGNECNIKKIDEGFIGSVNVKGKLGCMKVEFHHEKGVRVASSTCCCQICVNFGWSKSEAVVCVPNAVVIQPLLNNEKLDAVTR